MECVPTVSVAVVSEALPLLRATVPRELAPSKNSTVPVGPKDGLTVAVNVTVCPVDEGFSDDVNAVVVLALFTVCVIAEDVLTAKLASPL
jgi:hypothetical protein